MRLRSWSTLICGEKFVPATSKGAPVLMALKFGKAPVLSLLFPKKLPSDLDAVAILVDVDLRREIRAGDVEGRACVDGVEIREGAGVIVAIPKKVAFRSGCGCDPGRR